LSSRVGTSLQVILVTGAFLCLSSAANSQEQETSEQVVARVMKAIQREGWRRAKSGIGQAPALKPQSAEENFVAAQVYWGERARQMAIEALEKAIEIRPVYPDAHLLLAQCFADFNPEKAREHAQIAIAQGVSGFPSYRLLGELEIAKGDVPAAISSLETTLRYSTIIDEEGANRIREQLSMLREFSERFASFAHMEALQKSEDIVGPVLLNNPQPRYTEKARALKIQGWAGMFLLVTENGDVESVFLYRGLGHGLDAQAMEAAHALKFSPATQRGTPVRYLTRLSVQFNLK
jgi:TonB family protein